MPSTTERVMRGCFPPVRRPALPSPLEGSKPAGTGTGLQPSSPVSKLPSPAVIDDYVLYPNEAEPEVDAARLSTAIASRRFFLASPGRSNSIIDSAKHAATPHPRGKPTSGNARALRREATNAFPAAATGNPKRAPSRLRYDDIRAEQMMSGAPRADFLESMVEIASVIGLDPRRGAADVATLQELLLFYIAVNEHDTISDIIRAYAELLCLLGGNAAADVTQQTAA